MIWNSKRKLISVIVPVYNEEMNIESFYTAVRDELARLNNRFDYEFIFTDNRSTDGSFERLKALALQDPHVRVIRFSKNFGYQKSILTGYNSARGDCAIQMDCDLQDPVSLIPQFIRIWEEGADVVYGIRQSRQESWVMQGLRRLFYRVVDLLSEDSLPLDAGDFRLVDRKVLDYLKTLRDVNPYLRGAVGKVGFDQVGVPYHREARRAGKSKFTLGCLISLAVDGVLNHSIVPLRLATFFGLLISTGLLIYFTGLFLGRLLFHQEWPAGFATTSVLILISISLNALFLGIIGEYLGRIYRQVKREPITVIDETVNCKLPEVLGANQHLD